VTKRLAEDWLRGTLDQARHGTSPGMVRTGATFTDTADEYLRHVEHARERKPSTGRYRPMINAHVLPAFGDMPAEDVTAKVIERWIAGFEGSMRSRSMLLIQRHGILGRATQGYGLSTNAASEVERFQQKASGDIQVFSPEEVWALVRAVGSEQDAALLLAAAFTGLRMGELLALCWRDRVFTGNVGRVRASYYLGKLMTPSQERCARCRSRRPSRPPWRPWASAGGGPTMRYLHYVPREEDTRLVAEAFQVDGLPELAPKKWD
jgi:integrase